LGKLSITKQWQTGGLRFRKVQVLLFAVYKLHIFKKKHSRRTKQIPPLLLEDKNMV